MYDYGSKIANEFHYKQDTPPKFNPENITK